MLYAAYELSRRAGAPVVHASALAVRGLDALPPAVRRRSAVRRVRAAHEVASRLRATHVRPAFGIADAGPGQVPVTERVGWRSPFATMLHFDKPGASGQPQVLVVGPLSGHFTTLIRPAIRTLLGDHDVHVLDWHNARDVPLEAGPFGLDDYVDHVLRALRTLGPDTHVVSVCQPAVPVLAAVSLLAQDDDPAQPASLTLIAGPVDPRIAPTAIDVAAVTRPLSWFEKRVITTVPPWYAGAGRRVYPGFLQLSAFLSMNRKRHVDAHRQLYRDLVAGNDEQAGLTKAFYDEYGAVLDTPAEFYLETVSRVFQDALLPRGLFEVRGRRVDPSAIRRTALLTVEGERDDLCAPGQTEAAHALCTGVAPEQRGHHLQAGVGHYGVFSGSRWEREIYPVLRDFVRSAERVQAAAG